MTPTLVRAAEAVLRCALEPALEPHAQDQQSASAREASPARYPQHVQPLVSVRLICGTCATFLKQETLIYLR